MHMIYMRTFYLCLFLVVELSQQFGRNVSCIDSRELVFVSFDSCHSIKLIDIKE